MFTFVVNTLYVFHIIFSANRKKPDFRIFGGENENWVNWENWVGRETIVLKNPRGKSGRERENR